MDGERPKPNPSRASWFERGAAQAVSLRGADQLPEFVQRCGELAGALDAVFPSDASGGSIPAPAHVSGREALAQSVADAHLDTQALAARAMFAKPDAFQAFWSGVGSKLHEIERLLDPDRRRTQREREEIVATLRSELVFEGNPFPAVPDFREDLQTRLHIIAAAFERLSGSEPYASLEARSLNRTGIDLITLGRSVMMHFARTDGDAPGIYVCRFDRKHREASADKLAVTVTEFLPTDREMVRLVAADGWKPLELRVSPHGDYLAYLTSGPLGRQVGWSNASKPGELGRVAGAAFTWTSKGQTLLVLDSVAGVIWRIDAATAQPRELVKLPRLSAAAVPRLVVSPDGSRVAVSYGVSGTNVVELHVIEYEGRSAVLRQIATERANDGSEPIDLLPFWSKDGTQLACLVVGGEIGTAMICAHTLGEKREPELLFTSKDRAVLASTPSWSATGRWIVMARADARNQPTLSLFDCDYKVLVNLESIGSLGGRLEFGDEAILVHGGTVGASIWLKNLSQQREEPEHF